MSEASSAETAGAPAVPDPPPGRFERLMLHRLPVWLVLLSWLLALAGLIAFGALVRYRMEGGKQFSFLARAAVAVTGIPNTVHRLLTEENPALAHTQRDPLPDGFSRPAGSSFVDPGYALISRYSPARAQFVTQLVRLSDGKMLREYAPDVNAIHASSKLASPLMTLERDKLRYVMMHPYLMPDGGLVFKQVSPLIRIDACGKGKWVSDGIYHHSTEADHDGNLWIAVTWSRARRELDSDTFFENGIAKVSPEGKVLAVESLAPMLARNGLAYLWEGLPYNRNPLHLNDIEPVLASGPHWQRGDLLLSLRHISTVMLYRPSTGKVIWWKRGPWMNQHDVNVLDDHRITVFDNQTIADPEERVRGHNRLLVYDLASGRVSAPIQATLNRLDVRTIKQGRGTPLPGGDYMIEETDYGRLLRIGPQGQLRWQYVVADQDRNRYLLGWSRYLDPATMGGAIRAAVNAKCE